MAVILLVLFCRDVHEQVVNIFMGITFSSFFQELHRDVHEQAVNIYVYVIWIWVLCCVTQSSQVNPSRERRLQGQTWRASDTAQKLSSRLTCIDGDGATSNTQNSTKQYKNMPKPQGKDKYIELTLQRCSGRRNHIIIYVGSRSGIVNSDK